jgi:nucleoside-diphosphate-sugar epimerase
MQKVIITGADGFVGSYTVKYFIEQGVEVLALDILEKPRRLNSNPLLSYIKCDISVELEALKNKLNGQGYDTFIHFAWAGSAGPQRMDYNLQLENAKNTVACLKLAKEIGCSRFVCAGSIMEYEVEAAVHAQGSKPGMGYIYGMGKHIAHCLCKSVAANIGIDLLWPMITNAYGVGELSPRFVNTTLRKIINNEPLEFTSGIQNYDFVYVSDVAKAFYLIAKNGKPFCEYMIGSGEATRLRDFVCRMISSCDPNATPHFGDVPFTGINMPLSTFDISAIKSDCGFAPTISFEEGTKLTMDWLKTIESK